MSSWSFSEKPLSELPTNHALRPLVSPARLPPEIPCSAPRTGAPLLGSPHRSSPARLPAQIPRASPELPLLVLLLHRVASPGEEKARFFPICSPPDAPFPDGGEPELALPVLNLAHLAVKLVHEAGPCQPRRPRRQPRQMAVALYFPRTATTIPAFAAQQPPLPPPAKTEQRPMGALLLAAAARAVTAAGAQPSEVAVGALLTYDSVIGRAARLAIGQVVDDVNADHSVLPGTQLSLIVQETNCSGFLGTRYTF